MIVDASQLRQSVDTRGYEWFEPADTKVGKLVLPNAEPPFLVPKGMGRAPRPPMTYPIAPLKFSTLFHELATTPPTKEGIIEFANKFGFLGLGGFVPADCNVQPHTAIDRADTISKYGPFHIPGEPLSAWVAEIEPIALAYRCWSAIRNEDQEEIARLERLLRPSEGNPPSVIAWVAWTDHPIADALEHLINRGLKNRISGVLVRNADGSGWETVFTPQSLIGAIWLQFSQAVANGVWRDCEYCGVPFKPKSTLAKYCSDSHKQLAYQKRRQRARKRAVGKPVSRKGKSHA